MASLQQHPWLAFEQFTTPDAAIEHAKVNLSSADVPLLDGVSPQELHAYVGQVVRWTLMVQDTTLGSEVYAKRTSKHKQSLLFRESLDVDDEPDFKDLGERTGCFCVSRAAFDHSYQHLDDSLARMDIKDDSKSQEALLNKFPVRNAAGAGVLVKLYQEDSLKAADLVEFTGILDHAHFLPSSTDEQAEPVPCYALHSLWHKACKPAPKRSLENWKAVKPAVFAHLKSLLQGDELAAQYTLLSLISRIHTRRSDLMLGQFPLNLKVPASSKPAPLFETLSQLVTPSQLLTLKIATLNDSKTVYSPVAHDESLHAGKLQLPNHALVLVDETAMDEGQLSAHGLRNLNSLAKAIGEAKLDYVFPFSQFNFDVDFNFVVLSQGKSLLPLPNVVNVKPASAADAQAPAAPTAEQLSEWRGCIEAVKFCDFQISDDKVAEHIEQQFVLMRKENNKIGHEDLMRLMALARLVALSNGDTQMSTAAFDEARRLDETRQKRLQV